MVQRDPFADFTGSGNFTSDFGTFSPSFGNLSSTTPIGPSADLAFGDLLEEDPNLAIRGPFERSNPTPNQRRAFAQQRQDVVGMFNTLIENQIRQGQAPTARLADVASTFDFSSAFNRFSPRDAFTPRTQVFTR